MFPANGRDLPIAGVMLSLCVLAGCHVYFVIPCSTVAEAGLPQLGIFHSLRKWGLKPAQKTSCITSCIVRKLEHSSVLSELWWLGSWQCFSLGVSCGCLAKALTWHDVDLTMATQEVQQMVARQDYVHLDALAWLCCASSRILGV